MSTQIEERRAYVAGLRDLADLIEGSPWLPVPFHTSAQAGVDTGMDEAGRFAALRAVAELLGADVVENANGTRRAARKLPGRIEYFAHVNPDAVIEPEDRPSRIVPAAEDERLSAGLAVAR